jgi:hypothetical protein
VNNTAIYPTPVELIDTEQIRNHARKLVDLGFHPVVIPPSRECIQDDDSNKQWITTLGKRPTLEGWPTAALEDWVAPEDIPPECNLGILCGTPVLRENKTYYVTDIDIDKAAAVPVFKCTFQAFGLPQAYSWGRDGKRDSHHLFLVDRPLLTTTGKAIFRGIAELRCQSSEGEYKPYGHQSVTFPSVWSKGDKIEIISQESNSATEPPTVDAGLLFKAYKTAIAVCLFTALMPEHPRHDIRCAFFRIASKSGLSRNDAVRFIALADAFSINPERNLSKFQQEAKDIYKKHRGW